MENKPQKSNWKHKLHEIIYEADTSEGKLFDVILLIAILASIILVMLESVDSFDAKYHDSLIIGEWVITILFSLEYIFRIISIKKPTKYIFSFFGIIDFLSTIPIYLSLIYAGSQGLVALRALRLLRVFRILKLARYIGASNKLLLALKASKAKIAVFLFFVLIVCIILGTVMYMIEGAENGFNNIPKSIYWAIVTLTTVGFGDIAPQTPLGQLISSVIMILGYSIIAIPTGIVSSEMTKTPDEHNTSTQSCPNCLKEKHREKAVFCYNCGSILNP
ncbi:ion transporter [Polaribacter dokdonensis]|uniref:Potassium voltage-gated channel n=1 Tax=Polaribacter dokdonensis DSW-5 TaxID=1300348 RepID=A0A0M9CH95_9FLAO|nr:ion transporter [Polaribacter dokdonensis]KOY52502.1 Potassium voltage-gated channel [Polaribacter dokdonensis DSW-5]SEE46732.1 voltage-gated potassium channel [Polaribacter dokdonensis DSW-5]